MDKILEGLIVLVETDGYYEGDLSESYGIEFIDKNKALTAFNRLLASPNPNEVEDKGDYIGSNFYGIDFEGRGFYFVTNDVVNKYVHFDFVHLEWK